MNTRKTTPLGILALLGLSVLTFTQLDRAPAEEPPEPSAENPASRTTAASEHEELAVRQLRASPASAQAEDADPTWIVDQIMVAPRPGASLQAIAQRHGAQLLRTPGRSGMGALALSPSTQLHALRADPEVHTVAPMARSRAAGAVTEAQSAVASAAEQLAEADTELELLTAELNAAEELLAMATGDLDEALLDGSSAELIAQLEAVEAEAQTLLAEIETAWDEALDAVDAAEAALSAAQGTANEAIAAASERQWHLVHSGHPGWTGESGPDVSAGSGVVVAILDSGIALDSAGQPAASSLIGHSLLAPRDVVDDDSIPEDAHQHGTHIASLVAGRGAAWGVAPGVTLLPVRVLDENNTGTELDLIEGMWHAIDNGAQVINLSLTFGADYVPSAAMSEVLRAARDAGVVVVGAAGNDSGTSALWPAASPHVIAVGATTLNKKAHKKGTVHGLLEHGPRHRAGGGGRRPRRRHRQQRRA